MTEQEDRLSSQAGTVRLDAFTHCLVAKCGPEVSCLVSSFVRAKGNGYSYLGVLVHYMHASSLLTRRHKHLYSVYSGFLLQYQIILYKY